MKASCHQSSLFDKQLWITGATVQHCSPQEPPCLKESLSSAPWCPAGHSPEWPLPWTLSEPARFLEVRGQARGVKMAHGMFSAALLLLFLWHMQRKGWYLVICPLVLASVNLLTGRDSERGRSGHLLYPPYLERKPTVITGWAYGHVYISHRSFLKCKDLLQETSWGRD